MNRLVTYGLMAAVVFGFYGCGGSDDANTLGDWVKRAEFGGNARSGAVSFVINDIAYVGTGFDGRDYLSDFWQFNPDATGGYGGWKQVDSFPGIPRTGAVAFAADGKGYVTTGYNGNYPNYFKDTWMYDPTSNSWTQKKDFGGTARAYAVAFGLNNLGYVTTGQDGTYRNDCWVYDPGTDNWTAQPSGMPGSKRMYAMSFVINNMAYIVGGISNNSLVNDLWAFDPSRPSGDQWVKKNDITNTSIESYDDSYTSIQRQQGVTFVVGDSAYIATGQGVSGSTNTVWLYDPKTDLWTICPNNFPASPRVGAVGFSLKNRGFIGLGTPSSGSIYPNDDFHEYKPYTVYNAADDSQ